MNENSPYSWAPCSPVGGTVSTSCKGLLTILGRSNSSKGAMICKSGERNLFGSGLRSFTGART